MRGLARLLVIVPFALLLAVTASTTFLVVASMVDPLLAAFMGEVVWAGLWTLFDGIALVDDPASYVEGAILGAGRIAFALFVAPPLLVSLVSEVLSARGFLWHAALTGLITGAVPFLARGAGHSASPEEIHIAAILALAGAVAGAVSWAIAGRSAGLFYRDETARILSAKAENRPANE